MSDHSRLPATRVLIGVVLIAAVLMPPFFTAGACDAEFNHAAVPMTDNRLALASPELAAVYFWRTLGLPVRVLSAEECRRSKPDFVDACGSGDLVYVKIPVHDLVCRIYRDSAIQVRLQYDEQGHLQQMRPDMKPYRVLRLPWFGVEWFWGR